LGLSCMTLSFFPKLFDREWLDGLRRQGYLHLF